MNVLDFCNEYQPMSSVIDGVVRGGYLYTLTARMGTGKTAFNVVAALAVATGRKDILGLEVEKGRVAYLAFENPDDTRPRIIAAADHFGVELSEIADQIEVITERKKPEELCAELDAKGPFSLTLIDTLQSFMAVKSSNDNAEAVEFLHRVRPMTRIKGNPAVLISAHPVKNAGDDNLVPYGASAVGNELDGNLTLSSKRGLIKLHWQGKIRGADFIPPIFQIELVNTPSLLDTKGRRVPAPVMSRAEAFDVSSPVEEDRRLLRALAADPGAPQRKLADAADLKSVSAVNRRLKALEHGGLVEQTSGGKWNVTETGRASAYDS